MHIINHIRFLALHLCAQLICPLPLKSPPLGRVLGISDRAVARQTDPKRVGHLLLGSNAHSRQGIMAPVGTETSYIRRARELYYSQSSKVDSCGKD